ncbi:MAG: HIT domain-containing protein [Pseudomonadota bacterium]
MMMNEQCPFCRNIAGLNDDCVFVERGLLVTAFLNPRQYEKGAMLLVPNEHRVTLLEMTDDELAAIAVLSKQLAQRATDAFGASGISIWQKNGRSAGQYVGHYHMHVIPRYADSDPKELFLGADFPRTDFETRTEIATRLLH